MATVFTGIARGLEHDLADYRRSNGIKQFSSSVYSRNPQQDLSIRRHSDKALLARQRKNRSYWQPLLQRALCNFWHLRGWRRNQWSRSSNVFSANGYKGDKPHLWRIYSTVNGPHFAMQLCWAC